LSWTGSLSPKIPSAPPTQLLRTASPGPSRWTPPPSFPTAKPSPPPMWSPASPAPWPPTAALPPA